jgi:penicillin-insensitive murein endopeptidase
MRMKRLLVLLALALGTLPAKAEPRPARDLFGAVVRPTASPTQVIGSYAKGCLAGAQSLPTEGEHHQAMRLSRQRNWGHPALLAFIERLAAEGRTAGWPGLLVGDMAQPRGGPMRTGHASHQIGLDVDIWLTPMPDRLLSAEERETRSAVSMLKPGTREIEPGHFGSAQMGIIRRASLQPEVERIFVHPAIKQALCGMAGAERGWLGKVRPWYGHDAHFHVRLRCPMDQPDCRPQEPPPPGDGCGSELSWWLGDEPWQEATVPPPKPLTLEDLPAQCTKVLQAP